MTDLLQLRTAGQVVHLAGGSRRLRQELFAAAGSPAPEPGPVSVSVQVRAVAPASPAAVPITRGAWLEPDGQIVLESAGGSGWRQRWRTDADGLALTADWQPRWSERGIAAVAPVRRRALQAQVLLHYPALWQAVRSGLAPLHVSLLRLGGAVVVIAGPGGVGKSTLVATALGQGAVAACDNLGVSDGDRVYGVAEPLRVDSALPQSSAPTGSRASHGRREHAWGRRPDGLRPDLLVVLRRTANPRSTVIEASPEEATRALVGGTFAAGELQRFWPLAAVLALGAERDSTTSPSPALPGVADVASRLAGRTRCVRLDLAGTPGESLTDLLAGPLRDLDASTTTEVAR